MMEAESMRESESLQTFENSVGVDIEEELNNSMTLDQVLAELRLAWQNEVCSPVLLPHRIDVIDCMIDQIDGMESNIEKATNKTSLKVAVHRMELLRVNYMVNDYCRVRLEKIEKNCRGVLHEHNRRATEGRSELLFDAEVKFAQGYAEAEAKLVGQCFLGRLPVGLRKINVASIDTQHDRVFAEVTSHDAENVEVPDFTDPTGDLIVEMEHASVHLIPFNSVRDHVEEGKVRLL